MRVMVMVTETYIQKQQIGQTINIGPNIFENKNNSNNSNIAGSSSSLSLTAAAKSFATTVAAKQQPHRILLLPLLTLSLTGSDVL